MPVRAEKPVDWVKKQGVFHGFGKKNPISHTNRGYRDGRENPTVHPAAVTVTKIEVQPTKSLASQWSNDVPYRGTFTKPPSGGFFLSTFLP
jgi:hypothetical protein